jgi:hypothetical protein
MAPKPLARTAGLLYLVVAILGGFAHLFVRATIYVPGDAAATADNVVAKAGLLRLGFMADLVAAPCFLFVGFALYLLLKHVNKNAARAMVIFVAIATAIISLNLLHHFAALLVATEPSYTAALSPQASDALVLLMLDLHHYGYLIAQIFFGLWLLPLGYLAYKSGMFPRTLGVILMAGCFGYLVDFFVQFVAASIAPTVSTFVLIPPTVAELWMVGYLLTKGVRSS